MTSLNPKLDVDLRCHSHWIEKLILSHNYNVDSVIWMHKLSESKTESSHRCSEWKF